MPSQRPLTSYPSYYGELFLHVAESEQPFRVWVATSQKARTLRGELYNYRNALRDEVRKGRADSKTLMTQKASERVKLRIEESEGQACVCFHVPEGFSDLKAAYDNAKGAING